MSFFDKFKAGVTEAGNKAKLLVEINRIKLQNKDLKDQMNQHFEDIGRLVYDKFGPDQHQNSERGDISNAGMNVIFNKIRALKQEIEQNTLHIQNLQDHKTCKKCGAEMPAEAKFCTACGATFEISHNSEVDYDLDDSKEQSKQHGHAARISDTDEQSSTREEPK
ncbi:ribosomal protein L40E [Paenibacillus shirakamiensis]|uniref:Ribosomal protein L40E n=1 Tax=Paenibacillus shirakamiensis TaxID=1265935 RepID=A0ABS4JBL2_9BACL|nr:zinc ribbon domain-containing protein [Paenibacillus shirakamiensis]MBP1999065.1 ribosomal protein L40E [Paenibacillus shirakamiensis]